jgi:hypothetical protein
MRRRSTPVCSQPLINRWNTSPRSLASSRPLRSNRTENSDKIFTTFKGGIVSVKRLLPTLSFIRRTVFCRGALKKLSKVISCVFSQRGHSIERGKTDDKPENGFMIGVFPCSLGQLGVRGLSALRPPSGDSASAWRGVRSAVAP